MSQREQETEFLRQMLVREKSAERQTLQAQLDEADQRLRCIKRTAKLVAYLMAFSAAGVGYGVVFLPGIIERRPHFLLQFCYTVLTGCLISLAIYSIDWLWQSHLANRLRERCRQFLLDQKRDSESASLAFFCDHRFHGRIDEMISASRGLTPATGDGIGRRAP